MQAKGDKAFFAHTVDQINDHAQRLDIMKQAMATLSDITGKVGARASASDDRAGRLSADVVDNDSKIKQGLKELDAIVTQQGLAVLELRVDVQGALRNIASVVQQQAAQRTGVTLGRQAQQVSPRRRCVPFASGARTLAANARLTYGRCRREARSPLRSSRP